MIQRSECMYKGDIIGIESIYTVVNGKQINIPEKVESLREKGRKGLLTCPCGCGTKLIVVAGDKNLREQHFRVKDGSSWSECTLKQEGQNSIDSKIVIKCWLADKVDQNIETRVPLSKIAVTDRKYEVSHYVRSKKLAINYTNMRANIEENKIEVLNDIFGKSVIHIVDIDNLETFGQYPEYMAKIQKHQKYCLFLRIDGRDYDKAELTASFYAKDLDGLFRRIEMCKGMLKDYGFSEGNDLMYHDQMLSEIYETKKNAFIQEQENERNRRIEEEKRLQEERKRRIEESKRREEEYKAAEARRRAEANEKIRQFYLKLQEEEEKKKQRQSEEALKIVREEAEKQRILDTLQEKVESKIDSYIDEQYIDPFGQRWFKCECCGKVAKEKEFSTYGGLHKAARGLCRDCIKKKHANADSEEGSKNSQTKNGFCPRCGSELVIRKGKNGEFLGCSAYPKCTFTKRIGIVW